jgi:hypothetical protein
LLRENPRPSLPFEPLSSPKEWPESGVLRKCAEKTTIFMFALQMWGRIGFCGAGHPASSFLGFAESLHSAFLNLNPGLNRYR